MDVGKGVVVGGGGEATDVVEAVVTGAVVRAGVPANGVVVRVVPPGALSIVAPPLDREVTVDVDRERPDPAASPLGRVPVAPAGIVVGVVTVVEFDVAALASLAASAKWLIKEAEVRLELRKITWES
jgi:hypothetical protein